MYRAVALELKTPSFRHAVLSLIERNQHIGREELLDAVFRALDDTMAELVQSGEVVIDEAPARESHLDVIRIAGDLSGVVTPRLQHANDWAPR